jgi:hypothetical protein
VDGAIDGSSGGEASGDDSQASDGPAAETGTQEGGGDSGCTGTGATCRMCCRTTYATGYQKLVTAEAKCACVPTVCGPIDGGTDDDGGADASVLGSGACAATCTNKTLPDAACDKCLTQATGTMANQGVCYADVSMTCSKDTDCVAYVTCATGCQ